MRTAGRLNCNSIKGCGGLPVVVLPVVSIRLIVLGRCRALSAPWSQGPGAAGGWKQRPGGRAAAAATPSVMINGTSCH